MAETDDLWNKKSLMMGSRLTCEKRLTFTFVMRYRVGKLIKKANFMTKITLFNVKSFFDQTAIRGYFPVKS